MTNIIFFPIAIFLIYKAINDTQIFDFSKLKLSIFTEINPKHTIYKFRLLSNTDIKNKPEFHAST